MASFKKFVFGGPPFRFLANHLSQQKVFINDIRSILTIDQDRYQRLAAQLNKSDAFLDRSSIQSIVREIIENSDESDRIAANIFGFADLLHSADITAEKAIGVLDDELKDNAKSLRAEERRVAMERLGRLAVEPPGIARQYKAKRLAYSIGSVLDDFRLICDIRPVLDQKRERIEGALPIATLHMEYTKQDGETEIVEFRVSEKQIEALEAKLLEAKRKIKLIVASLTNQQVQVPTIEDSDG